MLLRFLMILMGQAQAALPVVLPSSEPLDPWTEILTRADLSVGAPSSGDWVELRAAPASGTWALRVMRGEHLLREVTVPAPRTPADREDLAALIASLAHSGSDPALPSLEAAPAPRPPPAAPPPEPTRPGAPPPPASAALFVSGVYPALWLLPAGTSTSDELLAPLGTPRALEPPPWTWDLAFALGEGLRSGVAPGPGLELRVGLRGPSLRLGLSAGAQLPTSIRALSEDQTLQESTLRLELGAGQALELSGGLGLRRMRFSQEGAPLSTLYAPTTQLSLAWPLWTQGSATLSARARGELDLGRVRFSEGAQSYEALPLGRAELAIVISRATFSPEL